MPARYTPMVPIKTKAFFSFMGNMPMKELAKQTGFCYKTVRLWFEKREMSIEALFLCSYVLSAEPEQLGDLKEYRRRLENLRPRRALNSVPHQICRANAAKV